MRSLHVLVVDDDDADTLLIEEALESVPMPPVVSRVKDGREALNFLRRRGFYAHARRPDLVLLDLNMPRVGGHEVLAEVKSDPDLHTIPVVVLSTSSAGADIASSYGGHANAFVTKPGDLDSFEAAVRLITDFYSSVASRPRVRLLHAVPALPEVEVRLHTGDGE